MNRREMLVASTVAITVLPLSRIKAQEIALVLPTRSEVARVVNDASVLELTLVAVDALRLDLSLTREDFANSYVKAQALIAEYVEMKQQVREGAKILSGKLPSGEEKLEKLGGRLQEYVQNVASYLVEAGLNYGSELYNTKLKSFWSFIYILIESGQQKIEKIEQWLCRSNPFDVLELCRR